MRRERLDEYLGKQHSISAEIPRDTITTNPEITALETMHSYLSPRKQARPFACIECHGLWLDPGERWRLKITDERPRETVPYCPQCATREFGPVRALPRRT